MANRSHHDGTQVSLHDRLVQFGAHISWPLFITTLEGVGLIAVTITLWLPTLL